MGLKFYKKGGRDINAIKFNKFCIVKKKKEIVRWISMHKKRKNKMAEFSPNCLLQESEEKKDDTKDEL